MLIDFEDPEDREFEHKLLGEWVYEQFDSIPIKGDSFVYCGLKITVSEMCHNRIVSLIAQLLPDAAEGGRKR